MQFLDLHDCRDSFVFVGQDKISAFSGQAGGLSIQAGQAHYYYTIRHTCSMAIPRPTLASQYYNVKPFWLLLQQDITMMVVMTTEL